MVDEDEFNEMVERVVETNSMFTGAETGKSFHKKLTTKQLDALINHKWPDVKTIEEDVTDPLEAVIKNIKMEEEADKKKPKMAARMSRVIDEGEKLIKTIEENVTDPLEAVIKTTEGDVTDLLEAVIDNIEMGEETDKKKTKMAAIMSRVIDEGIESSRDARLKQLIKIGQTLRNEGFSILQKQNKQWVASHS